MKNHFNLKAFFFLFSFLFIIFPSLLQAQEVQSEPVPDDNIYSLENLIPVETITEVVENDLTPDTIKTQEIDKNTVLSSLQNILNEIDIKFEKSNSISSNRSFVARLQRVVIRQFLRSDIREAKIYIFTAVNRGYISLEEKKELEEKLEKISSSI